MDEALSTIGLRRGTVRLSDPNSAWNGVFQFEADRLAALVAAAGLPPLTFEHMGSTAVSNLIAKPIIDFMAGYASAAQLDGYVALLRDAGYEQRGPQGVPQRELFVRGPEEC